MHLFQSCRNVGTAAYHWSVRKTLSYAVVPWSDKLIQYPELLRKRQLMQEVTDMFYGLVMR
jgi:hypothetical protein